MAAMTPRCWTLLALVVVSANFCFAREIHIAGTVSRALPPFDVTVHVDGDVSADQGAGTIDRVEIRSAGKVIRTIQFEYPDEAPAAFPDDQVASFVDVDCDGYKDLLVRKRVGYGGANAWYYLYLYDVAAHTFVISPKFDELPFRDADCKTKLIHTYNREGLAGCMYERGVYRWVHHELMPVRLIVQDSDGDSSVVRTIYIWRDGKKEVLSRRSFALEHCHDIR